MKKTRVDNKDDAFAYQQRTFLVIAKKIFRLSDYIKSLVSARNDKNEMKKENKENLIWKRSKMKDIANLILLAKEASMDRVAQT